MKRHLLVATNGSPAALGALRLALALSRKTGAQVEVLTILERPPLSHFGASCGLPRDYPSPDAAALDALREAAQLQVGSLGDDARHWPIISAAGSVGLEIARVARERSSDLILLGVKPRTTLERFSTDAALDVLNVAHIPVIAALPTVATLPTSTLVGVDFTSLSIAAAEAVVPLLASTGVIHLAHVLPLSGRRRGRETEAPGRSDPVAVRLRLERVADEVATRAHVGVTVHVFKGNPDDALIRLADQLRVDLIATGTHGYGDMQRSYVRSVSTAMLRSAPCSVLVVPPAAGIPEIAQPSRVIRAPNHALEPIPA